jgi:hypothetical protein
LAERRLDCNPLVSYSTHVRRPDRQRIRLSDSTEEASRVDLALSITGGAGRTIPAPSPVVPLGLPERGIVRRRERIGQSDLMAGTGSSVSVAQIRAGRDRLLAAADALNLRRPVKFEGLSTRAILERVGPTVRLNRDLRVLWTLAAPVSVVVPFSPERLVLYPPQDLARRQIGYIGEGWNPSWIVIGDSSADPVIADTSRENTPILLAIHGVGAWEPSMVAPDPCVFMEAVAAWLEVLRQFDGNTLDESRNFEVKPGVYEALEERLARIMPDHCADAMVRYIQT